MEDILGRPISFESVVLASGSSEKATRMRQTSSLLAWKKIRDLRGFSRVILDE